MRKPTALALVIGLVAAVAAVGVMPRAPRLSAQHTGDAALAADARAAVPDPAGHRGLAVALLENGQVRTAGLGDRNPGGQPVQPGTPFEIGSITKVLTGMLLAQQVTTGAVSPDEPVGALLPELTGPAREVTLAELASHRSGLPRLPAGFSSTFGMAVANYRGSDPYQADLDTLVEQVAAAELSGRGEVAYSNMGTAVLGHAVAAATGADYASLLRERLLDPVGMDATTLPVTPDNLPEDASVGHGPQGRTADPWTSHAYAPMGGVRSTPDDMELLARALLEGDAPGSDAMEPRHDAGGGTEVGLGWWIDVHGETTVTWHNGGTGGFSSMFALDREGGRAVIVLADSTMAVDDVANTLLLEEA